MISKKKVIRACTVPQSINFVRNFIDDLAKEYELILLSSPGKEWEDIHANFPNVKCIEVPIVRRMSIKGDIKSVYQLIRIFKKEKPTVVHSMTGKSGILCMLASCFCRVPVRIHTFTGLLFPTAKGLSKFMFWLVDWITCLCATHVIPEGEGVRKDLSEARVTTKPLKVLGYGNVKGVDLEYFDRTKEVLEKAKSLKDEGDFVYVFVGRILKDKGINELVSAFEQINKEFPYTKLLLIGPDEQNLDPLTAETNVIIKTNKSICCVGEQSDVRPYYAMADVAVLPSYREGFPNCVLEASAMGIPQVVTDINGSREIINNEVNGLIVPPCDSDALCQAMRRMLIDDNLRISCGLKARSIIAEKFEKNFVKKCLMDFYNEIIPK